MNGLDLAVVTVIVMSGVFAFARGFVKEALSIIAWIGAAFAALYGSAYLLPAAARFLPKGPVTETAAGIVIFLVVLILLSLLTSAVSRRVKQSGLSAVDRSLGLVFGLVRGVVLVCLGYLALSWAVPADERQQPAWIAQARTLPFLETGADRLRTLVPAAYRDRAAAAMRNSRPGAAQIEEAAGAIRALSKPRSPVEAERERGRVYSPDDQNELNRLIQQRQDPQ
jgi:membrane protein required for colicin V production